jgi:hypothetical protein
VQLRRQFASLPTLADGPARSEMPDCKTLLCRVCEPVNRIINPGGEQSDLSRQRDRIRVEVIVVSKLYQRNYNYSTNLSAGGL